MFLLEVSHTKHLAPAIDAHRELGLRRIVSNCHGFNAFMALARTFGYPDHLLEGKRFLSEERIGEWAAREGLTPWTFLGGVYGTRRQIKANKSEIRECLGSLGRLTFIGDTAEKFLSSVVRGASGDGMPGHFYRRLWTLLSRYGSKASLDIVKSLVSLYSIFKGEPDESFLATAYFKNKEEQPAIDLNPARDKCGLIWFAPILPARSLEIEALAEHVKRTCAANELETAVALLQLNPRTSVVLVPLFFRRKDSGEAERAQRTYDQLCELLDVHHYHQYRCTTPSMPTILGSNPTYQHLITQIKQAIDPDRVIAPGRYGV